MLEFQSGMHVRPCRNINKDGKKQQQQTHTDKKKKKKNKDHRRGGETSTAANWGAWANAPVGKEV